MEPWLEEPWLAFAPAFAPEGVGRPPVVPWSIGVWKTGATPKCGGACGGDFGGDCGGDFGGDFGSATTGKRTGGSGRRKNVWPAPPNFLLPDSGRRKLGGAGWWLWASGC